LLYSWFFVASCAVLCCAALPAGQKAVQQSQNNHNHNHNHNHSVAKPKAVVHRPLGIFIVQSVAVAVAVVNSCSSTSCVSLGVLSCLLPCAFYLLVHSTQYTVHSTQYTTATDEN
jgi:hypothetical protein